MSDYNFALRATEQAKQAFEGIKVDAKRGTSFTGFRKYAQNERQLLLQKKEELDEQIKNARGKYASSIVDTIRTDLQKKYDDSVSNVKNGLTKIFERIVSDKKTAVKQFTMTPPSEEMIRLITAYSFRDKESISDTELEYLASVAGNNYQSLRLVETIANDCKKSFVMPFTPEAVLKDIESLTGIVDVSIKNIDVPYNEVSNSNVIRFFDMDGENGTVYDPYIGGLIEKLDTSAGSVVPDTYRTLAKRLRDAQKKAYDNDNVELSAKIISFTERYQDQISTPEELKEFVYDRAEAMIAEANNTGRK